MSDLKIGELYLVKQYCWFLYPTKEVAGVAAPDGCGGVWCETENQVQSYAKWLSEHYKCNVSVVKPNTYVVLLEVDERFYKLLDCNGNVGWTYSPYFSEFFELVKAKQ